MGNDISAEQSAAHPALARFMEEANGSERLLFVIAAARTGRNQFARSWLEGRMGEVHDWSSGNHNESTELKVLLERLHEDGELCLAVILPPSPSAWALIFHTPSLIAEQSDLLLEPAEIESLTATSESSSGITGQEIHALCGGWLHPAAVLARSPQSYDQALKILRTSLLNWLAHQDPDGQLAEAAFLTKFNAPLVEAYFGEISMTGHTIEELAQAALVQSDSHGGWMMPAMVRQVLIETIRRRNPARVRVLEVAAVDVVARNQGVLPAALSAVEHRRWAALLDLLVTNWMDVFISSPRKLGAVVNLIPRFIADRTMYLGVAVRMLAFTGKDGMDLQLPGRAPNYALDRTAQRLHEDTQQLYRNPDAGALTVGILELFHLRTEGLFLEVGAAALRLRNALRRTLEDHHINPSFVSFVELQAGISLQLAGNSLEAHLAYENAFHWAQRSGKSFLLSDSAAKLSLLNVLEGNSVAARLWLQRHENTIENVGWGRRSITHTATLARASLAANSLDFETVASELATLTPLPDNEEFWSVHASLIAISRVFADIPESARLLIDTMRTERRYAAAAPMAAKALSSTWLFIAAFHGGGDPTGPETTSADPTLQAFILLLRGEPKNALAILHNDKSEGQRFRQNKTLAIYLDLAARNPDGPTPELMQQIEQLHHRSTNLAEIALLGILPGWTDLPALLNLVPDEQFRLEQFNKRPTVPLTQRPLLTQREREILDQIRMGMSRRQMAETDFRSENTIKTQIRGLFRKLGASNSSQALEKARLWAL